MKLVSLLSGIAAALLVLTAGTAHAMAKEGCGGDCSSCHTLTQKEAGTLLEGLGTVVQVRVPSVRGLWEVELRKDGKKAVAYVDYGKKHLIAGPIYSLATKQPIAGGEASPAPKAGRIAIARIPLDDALVMGNPAGKKKLIVFTDPDCPFCAKLHAELKKLVAADRNLSIQIKLLPLKIHPNAYAKAQVILESRSLDLLEDSFAGKNLPSPGPRNTAAIVDETIKLAASLGINATPTIIFPDGSLVEGYLDAALMKKGLAGKKKK